MAQNYFTGMGRIPGIRVGMDRKQYFVIRDNLPVGEVMQEAQRKYRSVCSRYGKDSHLKPVIRVFKAQGKPLLVLRVGPKFVSAFTWKRLIHKAAFGPWKVVDDTTLGKRWS